MLNAAAEAFLWRLFRLGLFNDDHRQAVQWVTSLYDQGLELPEKLETLLTNYWSSANRTTLLSLALTALEKFWLDVDHRTCLTACLFVDGKIDSVQAYSFLSFDGVNVDELNPSVRRVADVVWLLRQDLDGQIMAPGDDALLPEALRNLAKEGAAIHV